MRGVVKSSAAIESYTVGHSEEISLSRQCSQDLGSGEVNSGAAWGPAGQSDRQPQRSELGDVGAGRSGFLRSFS